MESRAQCRRFKFKYTHNNREKAMAKWIVEPLSKICKTTSGGTPSRKNTEYFFNGTIPWVKSGELENNIIMDAEE